MNAPLANDWVYLRALLTPLQVMLERGDVTDIYINRPGELWIETLGGATERHDASELDDASLLRLARQIAAYSHQGISRESPLLAAVLPDGSRVQVVAPPASRGRVLIAIRKHVSAGLSLGDYDATGAFDDACLLRPDKTDARAALEATLQVDGVTAMLRQAVRERRNILISGGTSTGKTTFLNALIQEVPAEERLIFIEDTPELQICHDNAIGLVAARSDLSEAGITADDLVTASLRMRPDRIILGELRGKEAFSFLRAINTGHPGSMTTVHADSPTSAIEQIALLVLQAGSRLSRDDIAHYIRSTIDVFVQLGRIGGRRIVTEVTLGVAA